MPTYSATRLLETLRDHLTQPEANVCFLLGAGASCAVRIPVVTAEADHPGSEAPQQTRPIIPDVAELTQICEREVAKLDVDGAAPRFSEAFTSISNDSKPQGRHANIEDILSSVRRKLHAIGENDSLSGLSKPDLLALEGRLRGTIAEQVNPPQSIFPKELPHDSFVKWIARMPRARPVEIFTTNYDVLLETSLEAERVPAFDGFVGCNQPFFSHDSLTRPESSPGPSWTRLWKIHGSITWRLAEIRGKLRVIRTEPHNAGEMILPSHHKYDESRKQPYSALLERFAKVLDRDDAILFVCGYSFSDEHINAIIYDALEAKRRPHVIALQFDDLAHDSELANRARRYLNLVVLGPHSGYIGGKHVHWSLEDSHGHVDLASAFAECDSGGVAAPGNCKLLLGDFARFALFLSSLTSPA